MPVTSMKVELGDVIDEYPTGGSGEVRIGEHSNGFLVAEDANLCTC